MTLRTPGLHTLIPDVVLIKSTGEEIPIKGDPVMTALVSAIAEDFMEPMPASGWPDVVSAAANASITLKVLAASGLCATPASSDGPCASLPAFTFDELGLVAEGLEDLIGSAGEEPPAGYIATVRSLLTAAREAQYSIPEQHRS